MHFIDECFDRWADDGSLRWDLRRVNTERSFGASFCPRVFILTTSFNVHLTMLKALIISKLQAIRM